MMLRVFNESLLQKFCQFRNLNAKHISNYHTRLKKMSFTFCFTFYPKFVILRNSTVFELTSIRSIRPTTMAIITYNGTIMLKPLKPNAKLISKILSHFNAGVHGFKSGWVQLNFPISALDHCRPKQRLVVVNVSLTFEILISSHDIFECLLCFQLCYTQPNLTQQIIFNHTRNQNILLFQAL